MEEGSGKNISWCRIVDKAIRSAEFATKETEIGRQTDTQTEKQKQIVR